MDMAALVEVAVGQEGVEYLRSILKQGMGMCLHLLKLPLANGETFSPIPASASTERAIKFNSGGVTTMRDTRRWLGIHLRSLSDKFPGGTIILQDIWAKPNDPAVLTARSGSLLTREQVYYYLKASDCDEQLIRTLTEDVTSFLLVGIFTRWPGPRSPLLASGEIIDDSVIEDAAKETEEIFVGAYDQEGAVVWRR
jgi:hypothetical protein